MPCPPILPCLLPHLTSVFRAPGAECFAGTPTRAGTPCLHFHCKAAIIRQQKHKVSLACLWPLGSTSHSRASSCAPCCSMSEMRSCDRCSSLLQLWSRRQPWRGTLMGRERHGFGRISGCSGWGLPAPAVPGVWSGLVPFIDG